MGDYLVGGGSPENAEQLAIIVGGVAPGDFSSEFFFRFFILEEWAQTFILK